MSIEQKARLQKIYDELRDVRRKFDNIDDRAIGAFSNINYQARAVANIQLGLHHLAYAMDQINLQLSEYQE